MLKSHFDKIFVINLPERQDRLAIVTAEMAKYDIPFEIFAGTKHLKGELGIYLTLYKLIEQCYFDGSDNVLIFEDDVLFVSDPNEWFSLVDPDVPHMRQNWYDIFYLGCNTHEKLCNKTPWIGNELVRVKHAYGCHAMALSREGMRKILKEMSVNSSFNFFYAPARYNDDLEKLLEYKGPIDVLLSDKIQIQNRCYCTYPLLATQRNGLSDIQHKEMDQGYIVERFTENTKHLY